MSTLDKETFQIELGNHMRYYRKKAGISQEKMAAELALDLKTYQRYERGERTMNTYILYKICAFFDITPSDLLDSARPSEKVQGLFRKLTKEQKSAFLLQMEGVILINNQIIV